MSKYTDKQKEKRNAFSDMHPAVNLLYFAGTIVLGAVVMHPVFTAILALSGAVLGFRIAGKRIIAPSLTALCVFFLSALINPIFSHRGVTVLFYGFGGNPITLESMLYGAQSGAMFGGMLIMFANLCFVMTDDKVTYLFGRTLPSFSLVVTMTLRLVKLYAKRFADTVRAQRVFYSDSDGKSGAKEKMLHALRSVSAVTGVAIESSLETANSMRARGFGTARRTFADERKFTVRDIAAMVVLALSLAAVIVGLASDAAGASYYPYIKIDLNSAKTVTVCILYAVYAFVPSAAILAEDIKWKRIESKI